MSQLKHTITTATVHRLFTVSGKPVYQLGYKNFTLAAAEHRRQSETLDSITERNALSRLMHAQAALGEPCEWRYHGTTEVMHVAF